MNRFSFTLLLSFLFSCSLWAGNVSGIIRGSIIEGENGEPVIGANILIVELGTGTVTDLDGTFSLDVPEGAYQLKISYIGYQNITIEKVEVTPGKVTLLENIRLEESKLQLEEIVVTAKSIRTTETALLTVKKKSAVMMDGISSARMKLIGDATAVEAAKRVTGVSIEGGKYVYVRGLGDRYTKTTLNSMDIPGLDPDRNTLQMDIFPTTLINNIVVSKNFTADLPADFTGGVLDVETKDFPEEKTFQISVSTAFNPGMHFNSDFLQYNGGKTDFLGFDDGSRALPQGADAAVIPTPFVRPDQEVNAFARSFNSQLAAVRKTSLMDLGASISFGNQIALKTNKSGVEPKLGYIFSLSYKSDYKYYDDVYNNEYQRFIDKEAYEMRYATIIKGQMGERNVLGGALAGLAYKTARSKYRLTVMRLQNGESRAGKFDIDNDGAAVGQSGYIAISDNLEYNQRSLTNLLLNGTHVSKNAAWEIDWRLSPTLSTSYDPDIRKTAFTYTPSSTFFSSGAGGNPSRIWRYLDELNAAAKIDITKKYTFKGEEAKLKFGGNHTYKTRDYEILFFDIQFFANQQWVNPDPATVLDPANIFPNRPNSLYYQSGNNTPNPNQYSSNVNNTAFYVSNEFIPLRKLKTVLGVRAEKFVQRHTGRDQIFANGDIINGRNLDNAKVLDALDFFPSVNFIYSINDDQNLRASYSRTIARPSFKELSFAQIIDPISNRIFNGSLFTYADWSGQLSETRINNLDVRWEWFMQGGQIVSISGFYKNFDRPIELVRIPEQQTSTEYQTRNVGDGLLFGLELELRKDLGFISSALKNFNLSGNLTLVESEIEMTAVEFNARKGYEKDGENVKNTRPMAGQAPYVVNLGLTYSNSEAGLDAGLFYNVKGSTLTIVGAGLFPDIFSEPFHGLDFSLNKRFGADKKTSIDFKVSNILNDRVENFYQSFQAQDQLFSRINPGTTFSLGLSHKF